MFMESKRGTFMFWPFASQLLCSIVLANLMSSNLFLRSSNFVLSALSSDKCTVTLSTLSSELGKLGIAAGKVVVGYDCTFLHFPVRILMKWLHFQTWFGVIQQSDVLSYLAATIAIASKLCHLLSRRMSKYFLRTHISLSLLLQQHCRHPSLLVLVRVTSMALEYDNTASVMGHHVVPQMCNIASLSFSDVRSR